MQQKARMSEREEDILTQSIQHQISQLRGGGDADAFAAARKGGASYPK